MALAKNSMIFLMAMVALFGVCYATVYRVGGSIGWTCLADGNYKKWAASKTFVVGDTIVFNYNIRGNDVEEVSKTDFMNCNSKNPLSKYFSGNDRIELNKTGHFFYICGLPYHCEDGQKVDIRVVPSSQLSPSNSPESSPSPSLAPGSVTPVSPKKNSAPSIQSSNGLIMLILMAAGLRAFIA